MKRGVWLTGGGALLRGLDRMLAAALELPVFVAPEPLSAVARGAGAILENLESYRDILVSHGADGDR
jgi:rod shape-determining protein MreB